MWGPGVDACGAMRDIAVDFAEHEVWQRIEEEAEPAQPSLIAVS